MNLGHVRLTVGKELRETLRDRRTLAVMILFPLVVYPLLSLLAVQASTSREQARQARPSRVAITDGTPADRQAVETLLRDKADEFTLSEGQVDDVARGRLDALVQLHDGRAEIAFDASRDDSRQAADRLQEQLATLRPPQCAPRFSVERRSITAQAQLGGYLLSKALPLLMMLMVLMGAFYPAIDATAGERERGTLETILSSPIARFDLLLGKVLAVGLLAAASGLINLASLSATLIQAVKLADPAAAVPMPWDRLLAATLVIAPAAFLFASAFVALGALARTSKEAQNLLMPVYLVAVAPAVAGTLGEFSLRGWVVWTPVMNITLLARDLLLGRATGVGAVLALGSTALFGALALAGAARIYTSERLVDPGPRSSRPRSPLPLTAGHALSLYGIAFILLYFLWLPLERRALALGLLVADWAGLLGLVVVFAWLMRQPVRDLLRLRRAPARAWIGAAMVGLSAWAAVSALSQWINPAPKELLEQMRRLLIPEGRSLLATLGLVALTPAVCEEALFRGPILRGLRSQLSPAASVLLTGLLFGLFHLDVARILPASLLGVLLSFIALESGSILPAMLAHFINNAILVVLSYYRLDERLENVAGIWALVPLVASVVLTSVGVALVRRSVKANQM